MLKVRTAQECDYIAWGLIHGQLAQIFATRAGWGEQNLKGADLPLQRG
jgi:hypothetical protein